MDDRISRDVFIWNTLRERLAAQFELQENDPALIDTLDGETELNERLVKVALSAKEDEAHAEAIKAMMDDMKVRKARLERSADYKRAQIAWAMQETGQASIKSPAITLSQRIGKPKVRIDETLLPDEYKKTVTKLVPDREIIDTGLELGTDIPGVTISNPEPVLTLRSK